MNYAQIRAFHAVAQTGSVTAASRLLSLTQPAITLQVKALENHYGISLFSRKGRSVELTDTGNELYVISRRFFDVVQEIDHFLGLNDELEIGRITIGADSPLHVMEFMASLRNLYPGLDVSLRLGNTRKVLDDIVKYRSDVAIISDFDEDPRFFKLPFRKAAVVIITSKHHPWAKRSAIKIDELRDVPVISREVGSGTRAYFESVISERGVSPNYVLEMDTREAIREAVAQDLGVGVILESEIGHDDRMHVLQISDMQLSLSEHVVCLKDRLGMRSIAAFVGLVKKRFKI